MFFPCSTRLDVIWILLDFIFWFYFLVDTIGCYYATDGDIQGSRQQVLEDCVFNGSRRGLASCLFHLTTGRFVSCCQGFCGVLVE
jgi:hypothetical protein